MPVQVFGGSRVATVLTLACALTACAMRIDATPEGIAQALDKSDAAVTNATVADRAARNYALRGDWRSAARSVDDAVFALRNARRIHTAVVNAHESAAAEYRAAIEALRKRHPQSVSMAPQVAELSPLPHLGRTVNQYPPASDETATLAAQRVAITDRALKYSTRNVAAVERIVAQLKRLDRKTAQGPVGDRPASEATGPDEPGFVLPPDIGFDQEVSGAQN